MQLMSKKVYERAIVSWPEEDRPREKLLKYGAHTLSNAELLAILIRTGVEGSSAVDLGRELLRKFKTLRAISACDPAEMREIKGLSTAKIAQIKAAVELGRRMMSEERALEGPIRSSFDVANYLMPLLRDLKHEVFKVVLLDRRNSVLDVVDIDEETLRKPNPRSAKSCSALRSLCCRIDRCSQSPFRRPDAQRAGQTAHPRPGHRQPGDGYSGFRPPDHRRWALFQFCR